MTSTATQYSRSTAALPQHLQQHRQNGNGLPGGQAQQATPRPLINSPYNPPPQLLHPGARNRLILSVRCGVPSEVDHALPRLVLASFDQTELFKLDQWVDSVPALLDWPTRWLVELEKEAALRELRRSKASSTAAAGDQEGTTTSTLNPLKRKQSDSEHDTASINSVLGIIPAWTRSPELENRSTNSLLILRNASCLTANQSVMVRPIMLDFLERFFLLPVDFLLDLSLRSSEPIQHILVILQSLFPTLKSQLSPTLLEIFGSILPTLLVESRDLAIVNLLLPLLISSYPLAQTHPFPPLPLTLIPYLLKLLTLNPPPMSTASHTQAQPAIPPQSILDLAIDLLITLTTSSFPLHTRFILSLPTFPGDLRNLAILLEHSSKPLQATWEGPAGPHQGIMVRNPASTTAQAEEASQRRKRERETAARQLEMYGRVELVPEGGLGDRPPAISPHLKKKFYTMSEPQRSIAWMHETFVYSSSSHVLQVAFWHAYRDFFQHTSTTEPLLSASEAIKNVTVAFPGAPAKIWTDERGEQKFVLSGIAFRRGTDDESRFTCQWANCPSPKGPNNTGELLHHVQTMHLAPFQPSRCAWATCAASLHHVPAAAASPTNGTNGHETAPQPQPLPQRTTPFTLTHLLTHLPLPSTPPVADFISSHPSTPPSILAGSNVTRRAAPPLPRGFKLGFTGQMTPVDARRQPTGVAFLAALLIRNLARGLKSEMAQAGPAPGEELDDGAEGGVRASKRRNAKEERFGLPIPDTVLKEEEEEERAADGEGARREEEERNMNREDLERARVAFENVEERLLGVVEGNMAGLGQYLSETFGFASGSALGWRESSE